MSVEGKRQGHRIVFSEYSKTFYWQEKPSLLNCIDFTLRMRAIGRCDVFVCCVICNIIYTDNIGIKL